MKLSLASSIALGAAVVCVPALASNPTPRSLPAFSSLAEGRVPDAAPPSSAPSHVEPGARLDDLALVYNVYQPPAPAAPRPIAIHGKTQMIGQGRSGIATARAIPAPPRMPLPPPIVTFHVGTQNRCLTNVTSPNLGQDVQAINVPAGAPVFAIRSERLKVDGGDASLEIVDMWADPSTTAVKPFATHTIKLTQLTRGPLSFAVYAFRHGDVTEIVIPRNESLQVTTTEGVAVGCAHARFALDATGVGGAAFFVGAVASTVTPTWTQRAVAITPRHFAIQGSISASKTSRDKEPVLSLTLTAKQDDESATSAQ